ncbi:MAG TPA: AmmeMemoRadiSam system protein B [Anaerolineales bacterium]
MKPLPDIRPSPIAGQWYPAEPARLAKQVDKYMDDVRLPPIEGEIVALMVPHAGHRYSGPVAGYAFRALRTQVAQSECSPDVVAVISPMHYAYDEPLLTTAHAAYATPLGSIPVETDLLQVLDANLEARLGVGIARVSFDPEHSLEIELPFLQRALKQPFRLLPIMMRDQGAAASRALGQALASTLKDQSAVLVASTDLSHFYPISVADALDAAVLRQVEAFNPQGVLDVEEEGKGFACGHGALAAVLWAAKELGADRVQILKHATSGVVTGDFEEVVGYGSAVVLRSIYSEG